MKTQGEEIMREQVVIGKPDLFGNIMTFRTDKNIRKIYAQVPNSSCVNLQHSVKKSFIKI
jgi:hypothetical protein